MVNSDITKLSHAMIVITNPDGKKVAGSSERRLHEEIDPQSEEKPLLARLQQGLGAAQNESTGPEDK